MNATVFARAAGAALLAALLMSFNPAVLPAVAAGAPVTQVPFGDKVSAVFNYNRTRPGIATAGVLKAGGVAEIKRLGFRTVLDLRTAKEGTAVEKTAVSAAGMSYHNIPISRGKPTADEVAGFAAIVENRANYPLLVHCGSANRVGAMWTLYRVSKGVAFNDAVIEGRTIGLRAKRENQVRGILGQPMLTR